MKISWQMKTYPSYASFFSISSKCEFLDQMCFGVLYTRCFGVIWGIWV